MTSRLSAITLNTFREAVRDRVLYNLVLFVLLLVASAPVISQISIGMEKLRQQRARLISITPINRTLEDYFLAQTREKEEENEAVRS